MQKRRGEKRKGYSAGFLAFLLGAQTVFSGIPVQEVKAAEASVELGKDHLKDRGVIAINLGGDTGAETKVNASDADGNAITSGVYVSWRSFEEDDTDGDGESDATFDVYRNDTKIASGITVTNLVDQGGSASDTYRVIGSTDAALDLAAKEAATWQNQYLELNLCKPEDETMPDGSTCTYTANDMSVGQLDGDGSLDLIVKWDPGNSHDNSIGGYTGKVFLDGYQVDWNTGETKLLWRIDMGVNIRAGAHYTQYQVWDFDGDGRAEIAVKTADGTTTYKSSDGTAATLKETGHIGHISADKQTVEKVQGEANYDYRNSDGRSLTGDEYFTIFNGEDGTELDTTAYIPDRGNWTSWGDDYGNRSERYISGTGYVMGEDKAPAAIFCRGYYTRIAITAFYLKDTDGDGIGDTIDTYWAFDTDKDGGEYEAQGNHGISINDVDDDGCDEIIYGSLCLDHDGTVLWNTALQHGDAMHVSDWVPDNPGLEIMQVHEDLTSHMDRETINVQVEIHDAATGTLLMGYATGADTGRGLAADIDPTSAGGEWYAGYGPEGVKNSASRAVFASTSTMEELVQLGETGYSPAMNFSIFWDGDLLSELYDGDTNQNPQVTKWNYQTGKDSDTLFSSTEVKNNNSTKNNANLIADILGDWREEIISRCAEDAGKVRVYATTIQTDYVIPCLLENLAYREGVAWQNVGYNQPANTSYLVSEGVITSQLSCNEKKTSDSQVVLKFTEASDGVRGHEVTGYHLYRAEVNGATVGEYRLLAALGADAAEYTDTDITAGKTYAYQIAAVIRVPEITRLTGDTAEYGQQMTERDSYRSKALMVTPSAAAEKVYAEAEYYGDTHTLPDTVNVRSKTGTVTEKAVHWDTVDNTKLGTQTVKGVVEGYDGYAEAEVTVDYPALYKFDIGITGTATPEGWTAVNTNAKGGSATTEGLGINYTAERGYGFADAAANFQGRPLTYSQAGIVPAEVYQDYAMVYTNSFLVDLSNGTYKVDVICSGAASGTQKINGAIEGTGFTASCGANSYQVVSRTVTVSDEQLTLEFTGSGYNCLAGIIVRPVIDAGETVAASDVQLYTNKTTVAVGEQVFASASVLPVNADSKDIIYTVTAGAAVAEVSASGVITAKSAGTATIRAALAQDADKYAEVTITVVDAPNIKGVALDAASIEMEAGKKQTLIPSVTPAGSKVTYRYTSSNTEVAAVSASGEVTAVAKGTAVITCEVVGSIEEAKCQVKVIDPVPDISTLTAVEIPTAATGLVYRYETPQIGVAARAGYTVRYGTATYPGVYHAVCTLDSGYKWSDGTVEDKIIEWSMEKATPDLSKVKLGSITAVAGQKLSQVALGGSEYRGYYHWQDETQSVGEAGTHTFLAYFVPINEKTEKVIYDIEVKVTVTARTEELKEYSVTVNAGEGGSVSPSGVNKVTENEDFSFTVEPSAGYLIDDVKVGGVSLGAVTEYTIQTITENIEVEVSFKKIEKYAVTASAGTGGSVTPESSTVNAGEDVTITVTTETGYEITDVKVNGISVGSVSSYTIHKVSADTAVEVIVERMKYNIALRCSKGGSIVPQTEGSDLSGSVKVCYGDDISFHIVPDSGYEIADIKVNGTSVGKVTSYTMSNVTEDAAIEAEFQRITCSITFQCGEGGSIVPQIEGSDTPGSAQVYYGEDLSFTVIPNGGYEIADVRVDGKSVGKVTSYTISNVMADTVVEAIFTNTEKEPDSEVGGGTESTGSESTESANTESTESESTENTGSESTESANTESTESESTENTGSESTESNNTESTESKSTESGSTEGGSESVGSENPGENTETEGSEAAGDNQGTGSSGAAEVPGQGTPLASGANNYMVTTKGKEVTYAGSANKKAVTVTIPATVTVNGITYSVTSIGNDAFKKNTYIKKVTIGKNVTSIGTSAFEGCTKLTTVKFKSGSKCKTIGAKAFYGDKALKTVTLPNSVQKIGTSAFASCTKLKSVTIGTGLKEIGKQAFKGDKKLAKITVKSTKLTKVGANALKGTKSNITIKVPKAKITKYKKLFKNTGQKKYKVVKK